MIKIILFLSILILTFSCGNKDQGQPAAANTSPLGEREKPVSSCSVKFNKEDLPEVTVVKANQARTECRLSEDEVVELVRLSN